MKFKDPLLQLVFCYLRSNIVPSSEQKVYAVYDIASFRYLTKYIYYAIIIINSLFNISFCGVSEAGHRSALCAHS